MSTPLALSALAAVSLLSAVATTGCNGVECAEGTIDQNGSCVPAQGGVEGDACGPGTVIGSSGMCEPFPVVTCGENTLEVEDENGNITCEGQGTTDCSQDLQCAAPSGNKVSICGRIHRVEDESNLQAAVPTFARCDEGGAADGPCELTMGVYDALEFAGDPKNATQLPYDDAFIDDCGRFKIEGVTRPGLGFLGIGLDDDPGTIYHLTGSAFPFPSSGIARNDDRIYIVREETDATWSADASLSPSFLTRGAFMTVFYYQGAPRQGVTLTEGGATQPADDYYFDDASPLSRLSINPALTSTGINGAGILINSNGAVEHSGTGALPAGCAWSTALAATVPGLLFFSPRTAVMAGQDCP